MGSWVYCIAFAQAFTFLSHMILRFLLGVCTLMLTTTTTVVAQCSLTQANTCQCRTAGAGTCDLLPDLTISWVGLESYSSGPSEYGQSGSNAGRLRVSGSTPNIGYGPLEVRTANQQGTRQFVCGTDTFSVGGQTNFNCPNGENPRQIIFQQVYRKQGNQMVKNERMAGSMTYHSAHSHYHVNDWTSQDLCLEDPNEPDPRKWPVVATGAKIGFCLMDYGACSTYPGHCRTSQEYGGGTAMNASNNYPNYGLHGGYGCGSNVQGISVGRTDIYSKSLDMMWINVMDGLCNGNYWIVAQVDPTNVFMEENDENNWTAIPFTMTQQRPAGSGGTAGITAENGLRGVSGQSVRLTATPGYGYLWSNGATTRSIDVSQAGNYSVTVTAPCGSLTSGTVAVTMAAPLPPPVGTGANVVGPASAAVSATGAGNEIRWYADATATEPLSTGSQFVTPVLEETTTYHASTRTVSPGAAVSGGKINLSGSQNSSSAKQWNIFDAYEPFELVSVKVYATGNGDRHFVLKDNVGNVIEERYVYVPNGTHRVQLNMQVPAGTAHMISAFDDNTEIIQQLHRDNIGVSYPYPIGSLGAITGSTAGGIYYYYLYDWEVRTPDLVIESARVPVVAEVTDGVVLDLRMKLEGPFNSITGLMNDALRSNALVPLQEPYTALGFDHVGNVGGVLTTPAVLSVFGNEAIVDWVFVELRNASDPSVVISTQCALLKRNGQVVSSSGAQLRFPVPNGTYHIAVRHRNHLGCMTAAPLSLGAAPTVLDLTSPAVNTYGTAARKQIGSTMVLWAGNVVWDDRIRYTGANNDRDPILGAIGGLIPTSSAQGYLMSDTNLDGFVKYTGVSNDRDIILTNIGGIIPTDSRVEQLP